MNKADRIEQQRLDLDAQHAADIAELDARWAGVAADITTKAIGPKNTNTKVTHLYVLWA